MKNSLAEVLASDAYVKQAEAMIRRACPGCTCGIESSLAMKNAGKSAMFELSRLTHREPAGVAPVPMVPSQEASHT